MVMKPFNKDIYREIFYTLNRFMGIFAIIFLGVSFYAGLGSTGTSMKSIMDQYLDDQRLMDIRVMTNYGISKKDLKAIEETEGVAEVYPAYNMDALLENNGSSYVLKLHSISIGEKYYAQLNKPYIVSGRLPEKANEILVEEDMIKETNLEIGDYINLKSGKKEDIRKSLRTNSFKITGVVRSPYYISVERGTGAIGNGAVDYFILVPEESFNMSLYSEAFVRVQESHKLDSFSKAYENLIDDVVDNLQETEIKRAPERKAELTEAALKNISSALLELENTKTAALSDISKNEEYLRAQKKNLDASEKIIDENIDALNKAYKELEEKESSLNISLRDIEIGATDIAMGLGEAEKGLLDIESGMKEIDEALKIYPLSKDLSNKESELWENKLQTEISISALKDSEKELALQKDLIEKSLGDISASKKEIEENIKNLEAQKEDIIKGMQDINKGFNSIGPAKTSAEKEIESLQKSLEEARKELKDITDVEWYILDRESNLGVLSYKEDSDKIQAIGQVFPLFFYLVAALVSLTTMTRLVEEKRIEIGTLKSLGYGNFKILSKYLIYAAIPTLIGGWAGGFVGIRLFPAIIINAYRSLYTMNTVSAVTNRASWYTGIAFGLISALGATFYSCWAELKESPSNLMRPKAPKIGRKTIIEQIDAIWKRLSFLYKISIRNTFRYKKRFIMTVIGISGCTALLLAGFGIRDSVGDITNIQFKDIVKYHMKISLKDEAKDKDISDIKSLMNLRGIVPQSIAVRENSFDISAFDSNKENGILIAAEDIKGLQELIKLKDKDTGKELEIRDDGIIITEKLSILLNVKEGDEINISDGKQKNARARVTGICENYYFHYLYLSKSYYEEIFKEDLEYNSIYASLAKDTEDSKRDALANDILDKKTVTGVSFISSMEEQFKDVMSSLDIVIFVIIISAGLLAFVVLYNLTNINIQERIREIATLEVLGFKDKEVDSYIYRENMILMAFGILLGFVLGKLLHVYVMTTVESRLIMFGRDIHTISYLYAAVLTMVFSFGVNIITSRSLRKINMVEALKSIE